MKLSITYDPPPIPDRRFDWSCHDTDTYDGAPDSGIVAHIIGYGLTEHDAIAEWRQQWAEAHGADDWDEYVSAFEEDEPNELSNEGIR